MINLNLNNQISISQIKTIKDCNTELVTTNGTKQAKIEQCIDTKKVDLDKQSIIQLQEHIEVKETKISISEQHPIELIKGRDDRLYNRYMLRMDNGKNFILEFKEIAERNKNNQIINIKDWQRIEFIAQRFQEGVKENISDLSKATDPIVRHALDLMSKRNDATKNKLNNIREYLSTKTKAPEETKVEITSESTELSVANSEDDYTKNLLKWIDHCLNQYDKVLNKKYNFAFLQIVELSYSKELFIPCA